MRPPRYQKLAGPSRPSKCLARLKAPAVVAAPSRHALRVVADLSAKGRAILPKSISVQRIMGEGSFGQVFEGNIITPAGNQRVVLKRVKTRVQGAEAMSQMEHLLNVYASRVARGHCADFLGYCEVADSEASQRLTSGLWLVWKYEGSKTMAYYLKRRDTLRALAVDLQVPEPLVVPTVMKQIFEGLAAFHAAGLVHRDVKPLNMIFAEDVKRFKLIDLGACADLRTGTNYVPEESILDLNFCPPEQYVMPTDSPHIAKQAGLLKLAISPMLWAKHKPDRFDTWSAGIVMLQLAVPAMRTDRALRNFNAQYGPKYKYDLAAWRKATHLPHRDCVLLDADDGAGWDLLQSLLAPRHIVVDDNGGVSFVNDTPFSRLSAYEALKHRYIKSAAEAAAAAQSPAASLASGSMFSSMLGSLSSSDTGLRKGSRAGGSADQQQQQAAAAAASSSSSNQAAGAGGDPLASAFGIWRDVTGRLFDLEARIMRQSSATELQTTTVRRLKEQVDTGRADPTVLEKEEKVLNKMQNRLAGLQQDFTSTANQATGIFNFFGFGSKQAQPQQSQAAKESSNMQALRAAEAASAPSATSTSTASSAQPQGPVASAAGMFNSMWERLGTRLAELERKISNQASATERQSLVVRGLRAKVRAGEVEPAMLDKAERTLSRMERRLLELDRDYMVAKQSAKGDIAGNKASGDGRRSGSRDQSVVADAVAAAEAAMQSDSDENGSFWSRLLGPSGRSRSGSSGGSMDGGSGSGTSKEVAQPSSVQPPAEQGGIRMIFGAFGGGGSTSTSTAANAAAASSAAAAPAAGRGKDVSATSAPSTGSQPSSSSASSSGKVATPTGSGLFGGFFGRTSKQEAAPQAATAAASQKQAAAPPAGKAGSRLPDPAGVVVPPPAAPAAASGGDALVEGANRVIRSSVAFTGLAAKIAGDLATAIKTDAERYLKDMEVQEAAKRQQRTLDLALLALLREVQPPVLSTTPYEEAAARLADEARWAALADDGRRRELYAKYQVAAKKIEEQAAAAAEAGFRVALRRYVSSATRWEDFRSDMPDDPALLAVPDVSRRQQLFFEVVAELQLQAAVLAASQKADLDFTTLLAELRDPAVTPTSTWAVVRKAVAADPRCQALPERRRRELFEMYTAQLLAEETRQRGLVEAAAAEAAKVEAQAAAAVAAWEAVAQEQLTAQQVLPDTGPGEQEPQELLQAEIVQQQQQQGSELQQQQPELLHRSDVQLQLQASDVAPAASVPDLPVVPDAAAALGQVPSLVAESEPASPAVSEPMVVMQPEDEPAVVEAEPVLASEAALESEIAEFPVVVEAVMEENDAVAVPAVEEEEEQLQVMASVLVPEPHAAAVTMAAAAVEPGDDDDLSAALAGMEKALESAIKAVTAAPVPSHTVLTGGGNNVVTAPPSPSHLSGVPSLNGNGVVVVGGGGRKGSEGPAFDGVRLEELRKEQARLRAEYEAMAQRLREMEERLKSQAQLMSAVDEIEGAFAGMPQPDVVDSDGGAEPAPAAVGSAAGSSSTSNGSGGDVARGQRWR